MTSAGNNERCGPWHLILFGLVILSGGFATSLVFINWMFLKENDHPMTTGQALHAALFGPVALPAMVCARLPGLIICGSIFAVVLTLIMLGLQVRRFWWLSILGFLILAAYWVWSTVVM